MKEPQKAGTERREGITGTHKWYLVYYLYSDLDPDLEIFKALETGTDQYIFRRGNPEDEFGELKESIRAISLPVHARAG